MNRRSLLTGLVAAPAVILTPGLLMPVKRWIVPTFNAWPPSNFRWKYMLTSDGRLFEYVKRDEDGGGAEWKERLLPPQRVEIEVPARTRLFSAVPGA